MSDQEKAYSERFKTGSFTSALRWHHLDDLWEAIKNSPKPWYVYAIGHAPPMDAVTSEKLAEFIDEIDVLLRREHEEDYCGIVYADDLKEPTMVKIYDPHNLGVVCGYSENPPLPGWVLSHQQPTDLEHNDQVPANRRRWWERIFG